MEQFGNKSSSSTTKAQTKMFVRNALELELQDMFPTVTGHELSRLVDEVESTMVDKDSAKEEELRQKILRLSTDSKVGALNIELIDHLTLSILETLNGNGVEMLNGGYSAEQFVSNYQFAKHQLIRALKQLHAD